jgi:hypothetical protein
MSTDTKATFEPAMTEICRVAIATLDQPPGTTLDQRAVRRKTVADTMVSLVPHDPLETMLAGQCIVFEALVHEAASELLHGQSELLKLRARPQICASAKPFLANLEKFEQLQARSAEKMAVQPPVEAPAVAAQTEPTPQPDQRPQAVPPVQQPRPPETPAVPFAAERKLAQLLAGRGQTGTAVDDTLAAAWRNSLQAEDARLLSRHDRRPPAIVHADPAPAQPADLGTSSRREARVEERV